MYRIEIRASTNEVIKVMTRFGVVHADDLPSAAARELGLRHGPTGELHVGRRENLSHWREHRPIRDRRHDIVTLVYRPVEDPICEAAPA